MKHAQRIAIIGAGTAGLAAAIVLARQGHDITVFEKVDTLAPVGAGLLLQPAGMAVFHHLGALPHAMQLGAEVDALQGWVKDGLLLNSRYSESAQANPTHPFGLGMHRASLCDVLITQLKSYAVRYIMTSDVTQLHDHGDLMQVDATTDGLQTRHDFDLVLVANGARSNLRPAAWTILDQPYPWGAVWAIVPETTALDYRTLHQFFHGSSRMLGLLPTGTTSSHNGQRLTSLFWSLPAERIEPWLSSADYGFSSWHDEVEAIWPAAGQWIRTHIHSHTQFMPARYRDVVMRKFGENRLGVIGDAAHAMSPQLGQGANMALLDAWAIGQAMLQAEDYGTFWARYHQMRQHSIRFYQSMSRALTPFYQSHSKTTAILRDVGFRWMYRVPWLRQHMAATISGIKTGPLSEMSLEMIRNSPQR
jgi:2-polyprenyl-6-methoxyphenol hydroxylase-like FAD-dependent oxidoreductase